MLSFRRQSHQWYILIASGLWMLALVCCTLSAFGQNVKKPDIRAASAIVIDAQTGTVLYAKNSDKPLPPASTTKIMTGLLLAQHPNPDEPVSISTNAAQTPGSRVGLQAGQKVTTQNLLDAILLVSANDASTVAAEFLEGSVPAFVERMNAEARAANALRTHFQNPHGLQDPEHLSTARDLAAMARAAMQNPRFAAAAAKPSSLFPRPHGEPQTLANTNTLLGNYPGMDGVKTGWTPEAGHCFVGSATRNGRRIVTVVLNSPDWQGETRTLLDYGFAQKPTKPTQGKIVAEPRRQSQTMGKSKSIIGVSSTKRETTAEKSAEQTGKAEYMRQSFVSGKHDASIEKLARTAPRFSLFWLLLLLLLLFLWLGRKKLASLFENWAFLRRKNHEQAGKSAPIGKKKSSLKRSIGSDFVYNPSKLPRRSTANWLNHIADNPNRLLEPAVKRHAQAILATQKYPELDKLTELLNSSQAKLRCAASELLMPFLPRRAEETLLALAQDDKTHTDTRAEAIHMLARSGADRHEMLWLQLLLKDGLLPAANALARLPMLEDKTEQALHRVLNTPQSVKKGSEQEVKLKTLTAASGVVLAAHGKIKPEDANELIANLPDHLREATLAALTKNVESEWTVKNWLDMALAGKGYAVLLSLMEADTTSIRDYLAAVPEDDPVVRTRASILRWLLLNEGDAEMVKQAAAAGETLAMGAVILDRLHRWNPNAVAPDVLLASVQVVSARLGYTAHSSEQIAAAFRTTSDEETTEETRDLRPLTGAYAHPAVHDVVQTALHTENGLAQILVALAQQTENANYATECTFWQDKAPNEARLVIKQNLRNDSPSEMLETAKDSPIEPAVEMESLALDHAA